MKRLFLLLITIALVSATFGQRHCGSQLNFSELQRDNFSRYQQFMNFEDQIQNSRSIPTGTITIPVVVHIVYNSSAQNSAQNISDAQINAQIKVLNEDFGRLNADRTNTPSAFLGVAGNANIEFKLAKTDPNGRPTTGITRTPTTVNGFSQSSNNVKFTTNGGRDAWNTQRYLNIWVCNLSTSGLMGYSTFPADLATYPNIDGVVIDFEYFGVGGHTFSPFNKGRTTTHEVGHWLGLYHIWGNPTSGYSCNVDDNVSDTPNHFQPSGGCPSFPKTDACTTTSPGIMFMNFMDYTDDGCMNMFTNGQIARMRSLFDSQTGIRRLINEFSNYLTFPTIICPGSPENVSASNWQTGYYWDKSNNLISISNTGTASTTISAAGNSNGSVLLYIKNSSGTVVSQHKIWVGVPSSSIQFYASGNLNGSSPMSYIQCPSFAYTYLTPTFNSTATPNEDFNQILEYKIQNATGGITPTVSSDGSVTIFVPANYEGVFTFEYLMRNSCGWSSPKWVYCWVDESRGKGNSLIAYPNPVDDILTVDLNAIAQSNNGANKQASTFDIRLYNSQGNLLRQTSAKVGSVQFNVSNLPNGNYFLHVYDGVNSNPEVKQIIVKH